MLKKLTDRELALGLFDYSEGELTPNELCSFNELIEDFFSRAGISVSHFAAEGKGFSGKFVKLKGKQHQKLVENNYENVSVISFASNPIESDAPSYDRHAIVNLGNNHYGGAELSFSINTGLMFLGESIFNELVEGFMKIRNWSFGFSLIDEIERQPDFHVQSIDNGKLSPEEQESLMAWYIADASLKQSKLRSVYPWMLLNEQQLKQKMNEHGSLLGYIQEKKTHSLSNLGDRFVWRIPNDEIVNTRRDLKKNGLLIA